MIKRPVAFPEANLVVIYYVILVEISYNILQYFIF